MLRKMEIFSLTFLLLKTLKPTWDILALKMRCKLLFSSYQKSFSLSPSLGCRVCLSIRKDIFWISSLSLIYEPSRHRSCWGKCFLTERKVHEKSSTVSIFDVKQFLFYSSRLPTYTDGWIGSRKEWNEITDDEWKYKQIISTFLLLFLSLLSLLLPLIILMA